jgi:hypothetical protein
MSESSLGSISDTRACSESQAEKELEKRALEKAREIVDSGLTYDYIYGIWQGRHYGDPLVGQVLLLSVGPQSVRNSKGFHVQLCGNGGIGKSDAAKKMASLIDPEHILDSALTPQVLFYPTETFIDGTVVFIDDIAWNSELGVSIKRITSKFQEGATRTVTTDGVGVKNKSKKRLTFWVTSVDSNADEQIRDRFLLMDIDETPEHIQRTIHSMQAQDAGHASKALDMDFEDKVCWALMRNLKSIFLEVVIPFAEQIDFKGDNRAWAIFSDMIKSFAIFARGKRAIDADGRLIATEEDFYRAKSLYEDLGGHDRDKYTTAELKILNAILECNNHTATKSDIQRITGLSSGRVGDILNGRGRDEQQKHGLLYKCSALEVDNCRKPYTYKLPANFNPVKKYLASLRDAQSEKPSSIDKE